eukprot:Lankesteria_metandrocarpae@DN3850_c0_g1_i1.p1
MAVVPPGSLVMDVMAGVGGFPVYFARRHCVVLANDINPRAAALCLHNTELNRLAAFIRVYNMEGRDFLKHCITNLQLLSTSNQVFDSTGISKHFDDPLQYRDDTAHPAQDDKRRKRRKLLTPSVNAGTAVAATDYAAVNSSTAESTTAGTVANGRTVHMVMNLPEISIEFLDVFRGAAEDIESAPQAGAAVADQEVQGTPARLLYGHVYCFARNDPPIVEIRPRFESSLGLWPEDSKITKVRDVAPNKIMYRVDFSFACRVDKLVNDKQ